MSPADGFVPVPALVLGYDIAKKLAASGLLTVEESEAMVVIATILVLSERDGFIGFPEVS